MRRRRGGGGGRRRRSVRPPVRLSGYRDVLAVGVGLVVGNDPAFVRIVDQRVGVARLPSVGRGLSQGVVARLGRQLHHFVFLDFVVAQGAFRVGRDAPVLWPGRVVVALRENEKELSFSRRGDSRGLLFPQAACASDSPDDFVMLCRPFRIDLDWFPIEISLTFKLRLIGIGLQLSNRFGVFFSHLKSSAN